MTKEQAIPTGKPHTQKELDVDEGELDTALSALFGTHEEEVKKDEPLEVFDIEINERPAETPASESSYSKPIRILALIGVLAILVLFLSMIRLPWLQNKESDSSTDQIEPPQTVPIVVEPEEVEPDLEVLNEFFSQFPSFINSGSLGVMQTFEKPTEGLESLAILNHFDEIKSVTHLSPKLIFSDNGNRTYEVFSTLYYDVDDVTQSTDVIWQFDLVMLNEQWLIGSFITDLTEVADTVAPPQTPETPRPVETTPLVIPSDFLTTGGFSGGAPASSLDIYSSRYGNNLDFERLVFDIYTTSGTPAEHVGHFSSKISDDGKSITLVITGVDQISAKEKTLELQGAQSVTSVNYSYLENDATATITIHLSRSAAFKVFELKSPSRLIVDFILK